MAFSSEFTPIWTVLESIAQGIASILALFALIYSVVTFRKTIRASHYAELDRMYFDILRIGIEKPYLRIPEVNRPKDQEAEYDAYAYMVWNFLESVHDRCLADRELCSTWYPAIDVENRLHSEWFHDPKNHHKFKPHFRMFIEGRDFGQFSNEIKKAGECEKRQDSSVR